MRTSHWALLAGVVAVIAYAPALSGGFVYDDHRFHEANTNLDRASILWRAFTDPVCQTADGTEAGLWRPLRTLSFALDHALFGASAMGAHFVNALLHGAGTACVLALLRRLGASAVAAFAGAAIYALHPAQVECVAWISSRGDLLAAALVWGAILCELSDHTWWALGLGAAALLAKEQAVVWPALAWVASRLAGRGAGDSLKRILAPVAVVALFWFARTLVVDDLGQQGGLGEGPARAPQLAAMLGHQAWFALVPTGSLFDWQMPPRTCPWPVAIAACGVLAAAVWKPTRMPALWFLAALVPTLFLQAVVPLNILVADRFLLFALPALAFAGARAVDTAGVVPAVAAALCMGVLTESAIPAWQSDQTLWTATADRVPDHPRANEWLGIEALKRGEFEEAVTRLGQAAVSNPGSAKTRFHLASALESLGRRAKDPKVLIAAFDEYTKALAFADAPRAEGREDILPLATLAAVDTGLMGGVDEFGASKARALIASTPPRVTERLRPAWELRIESLARSAGGNPLLGAEFAARVREWGRLP